MIKLTGLRTRAACGQVDACIVEYFTGSFSTLPYILGIALRLQKLLRRNGQSAISGIDVFDI